MHSDDFDYVLPPELIAQHPAPERTASRLLHLDAKSGGPTDRMFRDLPQLVRPGDVLVLNDTRVINARLYGIKSTGGGVEVLIERVLDPHHALTQVRASHAPREGSVLNLADGVRARVLARQGSLFRLPFRADWARLNYGIIRRSDRPVTPALETFLVELRAVEKKCSRSLPPKRVRRRRGSSR